MRKPEEPCLARRPTQPSPAQPNTRTDRKQWTESCSHIISEKPASAPSAWAEHADGAVHCHAEGGDSMPRKNSKSWPEDESLAQRSRASDGAMPAEAFRLYGESGTPPTPAGSVTERCLPPGLGGRRFARQRCSAQTSARCPPVTLCAILLTISA